MMGCHLFWSEAVKKTAHKRTCASGQQYPVTKVRLARVGKGTINLSRLQGPLLQPPPLGRDNNLHRRAPKDNNTDRDRTHDEDDANVF
mmetsp:Transcript_927/g.2147  ORF Transcript_927/g.2147 Transcript_927/m.2147 type:complete len:88 (+) Transcript_927:541-804(+)